MRIIDFHTHIFPEAIAQKATDNVGNYYGIAMEGNGRAEQLYGCLKNGPVTDAVVFSSATKAEQVPHINDFIAENVKKYPRFIGFGTLHKDFEDAENEIKRIMALGLRGIKLHPDFQEFSIDDPKMYEIYALLEGKLPVLFHVGDRNTDYSKPKKISKLLEDFPKLVVIAAHMGGYSEWENAKEELYGKDVYVDTSSCFDVGVSQEMMRELVHAHRTDRVLFASDYPHVLPQTDYQKLCACGFSEDVLTKLLWENGADLLNLT